jgi:HIV-1 Vpr-binding protein
MDDVGNEGSNSCWAEMEPFVIGTYQMYPLTVEMQQRLILHYLQPMGEYQEVSHYNFCFVTRHP